MPTLVTGRASAGPARRRALGALCTRSNAYRPGAELVAHDQVGQRLVLGGEARVEVGGAGQRDQLQRPVRRRCRAVQPLRRRAPGRGRPPRPTRRRGRPRGALHRDLAARRTAGGPAQRLLQEVGGVEQHVGDARARAACAGREHPVLVQRVLDDDGDRVGRADQFGQQLGAAPAGHEAEEAPRAARAPPRRRTACGSGSAAPARGRRPCAAPLTNANVGTGVAQPAEDAVPEPADRAGPAPGRRSAAPPVRSAPTAKMNGLPVTAIAATRGAARRRSSSAASSAASPPGRTWSAWCGRARCPA